MTQSIAIIGAGGINSWFIQHLSEVLKIFDKRDITYVKIFDNDDVEEKNLKRGNQNFLIEDLTEQKAAVLGKRYNFDFENEIITKDNIDKLLEPFGDVIIGVDNNSARKLIYEYCHKHKKYLLDLRAQGTQMLYIVLDHDKELEYYNNKYFNNKEVMERKGSCQLDSDVRQDHIENANKTIAFMGAYCIYLKRLRDEHVDLDEFRMVY